MRRPASAFAADAAKLEALGERDQAEKNFAEAQRQREQSDAHLYRSLIGEARAIREARGSGFRVEAWKRLRQALRLETPEKDFTELRREAGACLGDFVGLEPTDWDSPAGTQIGACDLHPGGELLAIVVNSQITSEVLIRNVVTGQEVARLRPESSLLSCVKFSNDGKRLFAGGSNGLVKFWQVDQVGNWGGAQPMSTVLGRARGLLPSQYYVMPSPFFPFFVFDWWSPDISRLAVSQDGTQLAASAPFTPAISVWNLADGSLAPAFHAPDGALRRGDMLSDLAFSPHGDLMAADWPGRNFMTASWCWDVATREGPPNPAAWARRGLQRLFQRGRQVPGMRLSRRNSLSLTRRIFSATCL